AVDLLLTPAEQRAEHTSRSRVPGEDAERLDVGDADQLPRLRAVADVFAVPVGEQVRGRAVDQLESVVGELLPVLGRDALADDPAGDGDELEVDVLDLAFVDLATHLGDLFLAAGLSDELLEIGAHCLRPPLGGPGCPRPVNSVPCKETTPRRRIRS